MLKAITTEAYTVQQVKTRTLELELLRRDGSTVWSELTVSGMCNEVGEIVAVQGSPAISPSASRRKNARRGC